MVKYSLHKFTIWSVRTESGDIICTKNSSNMMMSTMRTMSTKTSIVPRTIFDFTIRIDVQERTFLVMTRIYERDNTTYRGKSRLRVDIEWNLLNLA